MRTGLSADALKDAFSIFVLEVADDVEKVEPEAGVPAADSDGNLFSQFGKVSAQKVVEQKAQENEVKKI